MVKLHHTFPGPFLKLIDLIVLNALFCSGKSLQSVNGGEVSAEAGCTL
ncbi:hypothetical protein ABID12_001894 [Martelella mangrovi]|uniref:HTH lysR-type domain-containing protein n=1 Tax=Martelella mangrovi TaxID=1397477 RepID=A0ABV2IB02_9HYPH